MKIIFGSYYKVYPKQFVLIGIGKFNNCIILEFLNYFVEFQFKKDFVCTEDKFTCNQPYACDACPYNTEDLELGGKNGQSK